MVALNAGLGIKDLGVLGVWYSECNRECMENVTLYKGRDTWMTKWDANSEVARVMGWTDIPTPYGVVMTFDEVCDELERIPANAGVFFIEA